MKILVTGGNGRIGTILNGQLPYEITNYDLPDFDVSNYSQLVECLRGHQQVIHLAWNTQTDNYTSGFHDPINTQLAFNVYRAAVEAGVERVIVASSTHAHVPPKSLNNIPLEPFALPYPDSPYGAGKTFVEALGRHYSVHNHMQVVCVRFGGVGWGKPGITDPEHHLWLSDMDCVRLIACCIEAKSIPDNYTIINAVSNNKDLIHDLTNPFGWQPQDGVH